MKNIFWILALVINLTSLWAQKAQVNSFVEKDSLYIGEEFLYHIKIETDSLLPVRFPEKKFFGALEVINDYKADTAIINDKIIYEKRYGITQFDSGLYYIPKQELLVGQEKIITDSIRLYIKDVIVDTTEQGLYPIKDSIGIPTKNNNLTWLWILLLLGLIGFLIWYFFFRKKQQADAEDLLPPYEWAKSNLGKLDNSDFLDQSDYKTYYTELTYILRRFSDKKLTEGSLEMTSGEFLTMLKTQESVAIDAKYFDKLERLFATADMVKFAKGSSDKLTTKEDRSATESFVDHLHHLLPPPTEEELMLNEQYRKKKRLRTRLKIALYSLLSAIVLSIAGIGVWIMVDGKEDVQYKLLGNPGRSMLESIWISSDYGFPPVKISTPEVLTRTKLNEVPDEVKRMLAGGETFVFGSLDEPIYVSVTTVAFQENTDFDLLKAIEGVYSVMEKQGARNIMIKEEDMQTSSGEKGIRVFGDFELENNNRRRAKTYEIYNFAELGGYQQIAIISDKTDAYLQQVIDRIKQSIAFKELENKP